MAKHHRAPPFQSGLYGMEQGLSGSIAKNHFNNRDLYYASRNDLNCRRKMTFLERRSFLAGEGESSCRSEVDSD